MAVYWKVADGAHGPLLPTPSLIVAISTQVVGATTWRITKIAHILGQAAEPKRVASVKQQRKSYSMSETSSQSQNDLFLSNLWSTSHR